MQWHLAAVSALCVWKGAKCHYSTMEAFIFVVVWCTTSLASFHMKCTLSPHKAEEMYGYMFTKWGKTQDLQPEGRSIFLSTHDLWKWAVDGVKTLIHLSHKSWTISRPVLCASSSQTAEINKWEKSSKNPQIETTIHNLKMELLLRVSKYYCLRDLMGLSKI